MKGHDRKASKHEQVVFTIGHSNHPPEVFLDLLGRFGISMVADVRSTPWSRHAPWANEEKLPPVLAAHGLQYLALGHLLGGRPRDPNLHLPDGRVDYGKLARTGSFREGIATVRREAAGGATMALLCAEEDPLLCHRHHLIAAALERDHRLPVWHIRGDGTLLRALANLETLPRQMTLFG